MAFKPYQDLINKSSRDPKMAMMYMNKSKGKRQPVTDEDNGNYSSAQTSAIKNRLQKSTPKKSNVEPIDPEDKINKNKTNGY